LFTAAGLFSLAATGIAVGGPHCPSSAGKPLSTVAAQISPLPAFLLNSDNEAAARNAESLWRQGKIVLSAFIRVHLRFH
jgi:hypothetical protein